MIRRLVMIALAGALMGAAPTQPSQQAKLNGPNPVEVAPAAPPIPADGNDDVKRTRNYPEQPPVIPHQIRDYQVDLKANKCLTCHSRRNAEAAQAPMISITHFMDREGNFRAAVSPRRYFCTQCHVPQAGIEPLVDNTFRDIDSVLEQGGAATPPAKR